MGVNLAPSAITLETGECTPLQRILDYDEDDCRAMVDLLDALRDMAEVPVVQNISMPITQIQTRDIGRPECPALRLLPFRRNS